MPSGYGGNKADEFYQRQQKDSSEEYATVLWTLILEAHLDFPSEVRESILVRQSSTGLRSAQLVIEVAKI
jgi:hypothetical protein